MATPNYPSGSPSQADREELKQIQLDLNHLSLALSQCEKKINTLNKKKKLLQQRLDGIAVAAAVMDEMPGTICKDGLRQTKINRFSQSIVDENNDPVYLVGMKKQRGKLSNRKSNYIDLSK